jgi:hypothetical protein
VSPTPPLVDESASERETYKTHAHRFGLRPEWLDREVRLAGRLYTIVGLRSRKCKDSVLIKDAKGRSYAAPPEAIIKQLREESA